MSSSCGPIIEGPVSFVNAERTQRDRYKRNRNLRILPSRRWPQSRADLAFPRAAVGGQIDGQHPRTKEWIMLVLSRKKDEKIIIGNNITIMVVDIQGDKVRLGIDAPREVTVHREEVYQAIQKKQHEPEHANS